MIYTIACNLYFFTIIIFFSHTCSLFHSLSISLTLFLYHSNSLSLILSFYLPNPLFCSPSFCLPLLLFLFLSLSLPSHSFSYSYHSGFTTGGGFSNIYETPSWQRNAVRDYFSELQILAAGNASILPFVNASSTRSSRSYPYSNFNNKGRGDSWDKLIYLSTNRSILLFFSSILSLLRMIKTCI